MKINKTIQNELDKLPTEIKNKYNIRINNNDAGVVLEFQDKNGYVYIKFDRSFKITIDEICIDIKNKKNEYVVVEKKLYVAINSLLNCYIFIKSDKMVSKLEKNKNVVIKAMQEDDNLKIDKYGNFIYKDDNTLRWHHKKTVVCKQRKIDKRWVTLRTIYYKDMIKNLE